jgi:hypothetical protein
MASTSAAAAARLAMGPVVIAWAGQSAEAAMIATAAQTLSGSLRMMIVLFLPNKFALPPA